MITAKENAPAVVLGAGAAGLSAAVTLSRAGYKVVVIEKQPYLGGLAATIQHGPYRIDFGPHAFHCMNDETDALFCEFCSDDYRDIYMKASLLLHRKYFDYPLKFGQAILRLKPTFSAKMIFDYIMAQVRKLATQVPEDSFEAWGIKRYGRTIYDMAFGNYSRKVWGMPTTRLHWKLAQQKLPDLNFWELVREIFGGKGTKQKILYSSYAYPRDGIGTVFEGMGKEIAKTGGQILLDSKPVEIVFKDNRVIAVNVKGKNDLMHIPCSVLFNTIPLHCFVKYCRKKMKNDYLEAAQRLTYRHLMMAYLEIAKKNVTNEIMVYLLDPDFTFNRIGEQKNIAPEMIPVDRTILSFEICTDENGKWWHLSDNEFLELAKEDILKLGTVSPKEILGGFVKRLKHAYPVYDLSFDLNLSLILNLLERLENVYSIGRQGLFLNSDIHDSMKMGLEAAQRYVSGNPIAPHVIARPR